MEEKESMLSFGEVIKIIFKHYRLVLGVGIITGALAFFIIALIVNPLLTSYALTFSVDFSGIESGKYPDGRVYHAEDVLSCDSLERANALSSANVDLMCLQRSNGISLFGETEAETYTLVIKSTYFQSSQQATEFLRALADYPKARLLEGVAEADFSAHLSAYENAERREEKIACLSAQRNYLWQKYTRLMDVCSESYVVKNTGKSVQAHRDLSALAFTFADEDRARRAKASDVIDGYASALFEETSTYKTVCQEVYSEHSQTVYHTCSATKQGGINLFLALFICALGGLVLGSAVVCAKYLPPYIRDKKEKIKSENNDE
ncbi:MAG: hypothetical protein IKM44_04980 [Clostridia bacterium]|nr:hypothetical protein [Clostridia bacterium]